MSLKLNVSVEEAARILNEGGLVALPTETVYGLAANALDPVAVAKIFAAKQRPFFDPLIVHIPEFDWLSRIVTEVSPVAQKLANRFWPGPLTLVLPKKEIVPDLVTSGLPSVAVRIPDHELTRQVLRLAQTPVAAPSANPFGRLSPTTAEHVRQQLGDRIDAILDGGPCRVGLESTILRVDNNQVTLLRLGGIPLEEIESFIGYVVQAANSDKDKPVAPGMLDSHYAPRTPLRIVKEFPGQAASAKTGLLLLQEDCPYRGYQSVEVLSPTGDLVVAAANFFQALHRLDALGLVEILTKEFPDDSLGRALNDRLRRAANDAVSSADNT